MSYSSYRGTVGLIRPTMRPGVLEDLVRALPEGICLIPVFNDVRGARAEFESAIPLYRERAEEVARQDVDLCSGPAKLCQALAIDGRDDGIDLLSEDSPIRIVDDGASPPKQPGRSTRIGLPKGTDLRWRWFVQGEPNVSG